MAVDSSALLLGLVTGALASAVFFAGLAYGMRLALTSDRPTAVLMLSAVLRFALLLGVGWLVTSFGQDAWAFVGYGLAFFVSRFVATTIARRFRTERTERVACN